MIEASYWWKRFPILHYLRLHHWWTSISRNDFWRLWKIVLSVYQYSTANLGIQYFRFFRGDLLVPEIGRNVLTAIRTLKYWRYTANLDCRGLVKSVYKKGCDLVLAAFFSDLHFRAMGSCPVSHPADLTAGCTWWSTPPGCWYCPRCKIS